MINCQQWGTVRVVAVGVAGTHAVVGGGGVVVVVVAAAAAVAGDAVAVAGPGRREEGERVWDWP